MHYLLLNQLKPCEVTVIFGHFVACSLPRDMETEKRVNRTKSDKNRMRKRTERTERKKKKKIRDQEAKEEEEDRVEIC